MTDDTGGQAGKLRARELGLPLPGVPGPCNAITDVPGVLVGYETLSSYADPALRTEGCERPQALVSRPDTPGHEYRCHVAASAATMTAPD